MTAVDSYLNLRTYYDGIFVAMGVGIAYAAAGIVAVVAVVVVRVNRNNFY